MGLSDTTHCTFCNTEVETIEHLFLGCLVTRRIWQEVLLWFNETTGNNLVLSDADIIMGVRLKNAELINNIIHITKQFIYSRKCQKIRYLHIDALRRKVWFTFKAELYMSEENKSCDKCELKWGDFFHLWKD